MDQPQSELQAFFVIAFSLTFLAGMTGSIAAWMWALRNQVAIARWAGWDRDQPRVLIGLIDLVGCFFCLVLAQIMVLAILQVTVGREAMQAEPPAKPILQGNMAMPILQGSLAHRTDDGMQVLTADRILESIANETIANENGANENGANENGADAENVVDSKVPTWLTPILTVSFLLGGVLAAALVMFRTGATPTQIGISTQRFIDDCKIGGLVFLLVTPVILLLSQLAISVTEVKYEHPVMDAMAENPWAFPLLFFGAVVCAPLWEEFVFRGLLIGWFDSIRSSGGSLRAILLGAPVGDPLPLNAADDSAPTRIEVADVPLPPWWPAIASGVVFGLLHYGYGVSWIPLIVLGIVLGRIYQLRRSIVPVVVTHALFNSLSMLGLAVQILGGKG